MSRRRRGRATAPRTQSTRRRRPAAPARPAAAAARGVSARPRRGRRRTNTMPWLIGGLIALFVIGGLGFLAFRQITRELPGVALADQGNEHIAAIGDPHVPYNSSPPTSGPHVGGSIARGGVHTEQVPDELQVHNLEDGYVLVQYDCPTECPELAGQLEAVVREAAAANRNVILAPYRGIRGQDGAPARIALTAWTRIDTFDEFDRDRVMRFIEAYEGIDHHVGG